MLVLKLIYLVKCGDNMDSNKKIKLIGLDLDGTLFNDDKIISEENITSIKNAISKGVVVVPVTGRPFKGLPKAIKDIKEIKYAVTANGASLYEVDTGKCIYKDWLSNDKVLEVLSALKKYPVIEDCFIEGTSYMQEDSKDVFDDLPIPKALIEYFLKSKIYVKDLYEYIKNTDSKLEKVVIDFYYDENTKSRKCGTEVYNDLKKIKDITIVEGAPFNYEVSNITARKGNGLIELGKILNIDISEIMAIGDSENDLDMIEKAGLGVAMENASDIVKKHADYITKSNNLDGVAYAINKFI